MTRHARVQICQLLDIYRYLLRVSHCLWKSILSISVSLIWCSNLDWSNGVFKVKRNLHAMLVDETVLSYPGQMLKGSSFLLYVNSTNVWFRTGSDFRMRFPHPYFAKGCFRPVNALVESCEGFLSYRFSIVHCCYWSFGDKFLTFHWSVLRNDRFVQP